MRNRKIDISRLFLTLSICVLFLGISFTSVIGQTQENNVNIEDNKIIPLTKPIPQPALPGFFYKIFNNDWNYWTNSPNMYSIPTGNIGIGVTSPTEKLDVSNGSQGVTIKPETTTINTTNSTNITITSADGNVIVRLG